MTNKKVSIIIPTYNAARFIKETIDSALAQTYSNIEVVIVNDGSTDNTEEVIKDYLSDKKIIYVKQENGGISKARNRGVANSSGEYIAFLDADDIALLNRITEQVKFFEENPEYGVIYSNFQSFYHSYPEKLLSYKRIGCAGNILRPLLHYSFICPSTVMITKSVFVAVGGFDSSFRDAEDWDLWRRLSYSGTLFGYIKKPLVITRLNSNSLSGFHNQVRMKKMNLLSFEKFFAQMKPSELIEYDTKKVLKTLKFKLAIAHLLLGEKKEFRFWIKESKKWYWPLFFLFSYLPTKLISSLIKKMWMWKQKNLFRINGN